MAQLLPLLLLLLFPTLHALSIPPPPPPSETPTLTSFQESLINVACLDTSDADDCMARIRTECGDPRRGPVAVLHAAVRGTINEALRAIDAISGLGAMSDSLREQTAIGDCGELLGHTVDELSWSLKEMARFETGGAMRRQANLRSWLSAALGNQETCLEGFHGTDGRIKHYLAGHMAQVTQLVGNLLEMYKRMRSIMPHHGQLPPAASDQLPPVTNDTLPSWIAEEDEELLRADMRAAHVDAVVASDGTGRFRTINEAVSNAPSHSTRRYVIFVKRGVYKENVELKKKKSNIMIIGEGIGETVITGSRNFMQGWTTFRTATFAVSGQGFIARDITFRNTAGPQNHQAVALRVDSDRSAFFRCSVEGYQDTLYAHSLRQFYRECNIYGTIDFIFGNGQAVFQNCKIFTRRPLPYQKVTITAQGRKDPNQNTGFSIHNCFVYATYPTYLGRPWKAYSRTVFMQTYLSAQVQPQGWLEWFGDFGLSTLFYGEYRNYGPGAGLGGRVRWSGYHAIRDAAVASFFTARRFIDGSSWLPATGVPFTADLLK